MKTKYLIIKHFSLTLFVISLLTGLGGAAFAQYSSNNYQANEVFFGSGGDTNQSSANYQANVSAGALGVGQYSSTNYVAYSGFLTPSEPFLELSISTSIVNMGTVDPATTLTGTANFQVRAYTNSGYTVQNVSNPPVYGSHTLAPITSAGSSAAGTEQFGINLVQNTSPASFGSNPSPQPNGTYATGIAAPGYDTANQFKFVTGDVIAKTPSGSSGWGQTNYTISYIANASIITPAGSYQMVQDLVAVATY